MDLGGINPADLTELLVVGGGVLGTGLVGFLLVRSARASRRRQIEETSEPRSRELPRRRTSARELEREPAEPEADEDEEAAPPPAPVPVAKAAAAPKPAPVVKEAPPAAPAPSRAPEATRAPEPERRGQVLPFPSPAPAPRDKPVAPPPAAEPAPVEKRKKDTAALSSGLARTRSTGFIAGLGKLFAGKKEIDPSLVEEIEKVLLTADIGVRTSQKLLEEIRTSLSRKELQNPEAIWDFLRARSAAILAQDIPPVDFGAQKPFVLLVIGVNGSGKTTTIGKLAAKLAGEGKKVLLAAGDTFRAAAAEQLDIWAGRTGATLVRGKEGADPSSVIFDGVKRGATEGYDVVIADTAGRLHTKTDLMQELQKVRRVVSKASPGAPHETWLVIDSTSGQNAIAQAQVFTQAMETTGIVLTKLDGTAKGGVILGIADQLKLPVRYIGVGERVEDLRAFDPEEFVDALFEAPTATA
ncbi:MAG TPA: signal recognition particle-docking protein FtsY [Polyangia bacterium]|nr:signal recognition particle-docking protein FtsY [Polyangia bacterium]